MFRYKFILTAAVLAAFMFVCFVHRGDAASITSLSFSVPDDWGSGANVAAHLGTDEDIDEIHWHVNGSYEKTTTHGNGTTWVNVNLGSFSGHIKGEKYRVEAIVEFSDGESIDTEDDKFRVYKPIITSGYGTRTGVYGSANIYSQYFDGFAFQMSASVYVYNGTENTVLVLAWFRQQEWSSENGEFKDVKEDTKETEALKPGDTYYAYPDSSKTEFAHGGLMKEGEERFFNAHTHIQVDGGGVDNWEADTKQQTEDTAVKFTHKDNPE